MICRLALIALFAFPVHALAQAGQATTPATPGTSLGSSPVLRNPPPAADDGVRCESLEAQERKRCGQRREQPGPASAGPTGTGMGSGPAGGGSTTTGPGTGTAPGMTTR